MIEYIGNVQLNLSFYSGQDLYTDGAVEDDMLEIAKNLDKHKCLDELFEKDNRWPVLYHFTPYRENLLNWYPFSPNSTVLEIGSGCGGITGALCKELDVTCIELSKKRSLINAYRHENSESLKIFVGNFNDIVLEQKFDYITLIGVLEYAKIYTNSTNPFVDFIDKVKQLLKPEGKLIVAIENRYGLKYWAGANEDHTGLMFEGITGYKNRCDVATFSKQELTQILKECSFNDLEFYYPYPDYKLPEAIYSDRRLPQADELTCLIGNYDEGGSLFNKQLVYDGLIKNGMYDFFANSFLVFASN